MIIIWKYGGNTFEISIIPKKNTHSAFQRASLANVKVGGNFLIPTRPSRAFVTLFDYVDNVQNYDIAIVSFCETTHLRGDLAHSECYPLISERAIYPMANI